MLHVKKMFVAVKSGPALELVKEYIAKDEEINEARKVFLKDVGSCGVYRGRGIIEGWEGTPDPEEGTRELEKIRHEGKNLTLVCPDRRRKKGKELQKRINGLCHPSYRNMTSSLGIPTDYVYENRMIQPGMEKQVGDVWVFGPIHATVLEEANLMDGCEVLSVMEYESLQS